MTQTIKTFTGFAYLHFLGACQQFRAARYISMSLSLLWQVCDCWNKFIIDNFMALKQNYERAAVISLPVCDAKLKNLIAIL